MPGTSDFVQRAPFLERLSAASRRRAEFDLDAILRELRSPAKLVDLAKKFRLLSDPDEERHLREDWYGETGRPWWPGFPVEAIVRQGYIEMIELVKRRDLPVDALWVTGQSEFRISLTSSPSQITMLFLTPPCPESLVAEDTTLLAIERDASGGVSVRTGRRSR
jgi:hypothetical protein